MTKAWMCKCDGLKKECIYDGFKNCVLRENGECTVTPGVFLSEKELEEYKKELEGYKEVANGMLDAALPSLMAECAEEFLDGEVRVGLGKGLPGDPREGNRADWLRNWRPKAREEAGK